MKIFKKKQLMEIIDSNGDLIGTNDIPTSGADLETQANGTTDVNAKKGQQPFRYDMLGRFGFTMMPFMEGKMSQEQQELIKDLTELMHERFVDVIEHYYRNPNKLKPDYRKETSHQGSTEHDKYDAEYAMKIMKVIQKHFEKAFDEPETLDEAKVVEDKVVDKRNEDEISKKAEDKDVRDGKLEKIAGLINKLEKKDKDKLKNLLEIEESK